MIESTEVLHLVENLMRVKTTITDHVKDFYDIEDMIGLLRTKQRSLISRIKTDKEILNWMKNNKEFTSMLTDRVLSEIEDLSILSDTVINHGVEN